MSAEPDASPDHGRLVQIVEALLLAAGEPLSLEQLQQLVGDELGLERRDLRAALTTLDQKHRDGCTELREVAGGWRLQLRAEYGQWIARLQADRPARMSRAALETLALIVYRQPITRGEIEEVRGVAVSPNILRGLVERGWVREVGTRDAPGRPALFGSTAQFLADFNLNTLDQLPALPELKDPDLLEARLGALLAPRLAVEPQAEEAQHD